jgi:hypothetical protein
MAEAVVYGSLARKEWALNLLPLVLPEDFPLCCSAEITVAGDKN